MKTNYAKGLFAEALCCFALRLKGYCILAQRCRTPVGEIDLIAQRGHTLVIIEVKARPSLAEAAEVISSRQRARLERAAQFFLAQQTMVQNPTIRFDAMLVAPWRWPKHIVNAWAAH